MTPTNHSREATDSAVLEVGGALDTEALKTVKGLSNHQQVLFLPAIQLYVTMGQE